MSWLTEIATGWEDLKGYVTGTDPSAQYWETVDYYQQQQDKIEADRLERKKSTLKAVIIISAIIAVVGGVVFITYKLKRK